MNTDKALVEQILHGEKRGFTVLVEQYQRLVAHIVYSHVRNSGDRDDLCQDIFLKVYRGLSSFQFHCKLGTWIGKIAYNACMNYYSKKRLEIEDSIVCVEDIGTAQHVSDGMVTAISRPDEYIQNKELIGILDKKIQKLPARYRTIIMLFHKDDLRYKEIADILGITMDQVKVTLFRARAMLKEQLLADYRKEDIWM